MGEKIHIDEAMLVWFERYVTLIYIVMAILLKYTNLCMPIYSLNKGRILFTAEGFARRV